jgi:hypothetical protein
MVQNAKPTPARAGYSKDSVKEEQYWVAAATNAAAG